MNIHKLIEDGNLEEIEKQLMDLNSEFRFKCRKCGKCCKHQDTILFTTKDIFKIARKLNLSMGSAINEYAEVYIGTGSLIPVVHMVPRGSNQACPFLKDGRCSIHDCKPTVCALFPLGRLISSSAVQEKDESKQVRYFLNDVSCGSRQRVNTVRDWLARFGIPEHDEFFLLWSDVVAEAAAAVHSLEACKVSEEMLESAWNVIFAALYLSHDVAHEFMPQFEHNTAVLRNMCHGLQRAAEALQNDQCKD